MKKLLLSMATLLVAGSAWAQTEVRDINTEKYYTLQCKATDHSGYIAEVNGEIKGREAIPTMLVFEQGETEGTYYIKSYVSNKYINSNDAYSDVTFDTEKKTAWTKTELASNLAFTATAGRYLNNNETSDGSNGLKVATGTGGCSQWTLCEYDSPVESISVVYSFKYDGREVATQSADVLSGSAYPDITIALPYGITGTKPEGIVSEEDAVYGVVTKEITLTKEKELPFETAASAGEITKWYYMRMHTNEPGFIGDIADDNTINVYKGKTAAEEGALNNFLWGFVGSDAFGITVVNKGAEKQLTSTGDGNVTLTDAGTPFFVANTDETTYKAQNGFCLRKSDSNNYLNANYNSRKLSHWGSADAGSTIFLYEEGTSANVTVSDAGYATVCIDYPVSIPEDVEVYTVTAVEGSSAKMTKVEDVLPENTGVIVKAAAGNYDFAISALPVASTSGNNLVGTVVDTEVTAAQDKAYYVLSEPEGEPVGFYKAILVDNKFKNNANKAYLPVANGNAARFLSFDFGTETAIEGVEGENGNVKAEIYDLAGRRVQNAQKGLYIVNGKKVIK